MRLKKGMRLPNYLDRYIEELRWAVGDVTDRPSQFSELPSPKTALDRGLGTRVDLLRELERLFQDHLGKPKSAVGEFLRSAAANGYYTRPDIIQAIWTGYVIPKFGHGFRFLDPGCGAGVGLFAGSYELVSEYFGIDCDPIAIAWATRKNPIPDRATFFHERFLEVPMLPNTYDLMGFNIPFRSGVRGKQPHSTFVAHAAKAISDGGAIVTFTSRSFLDSVDDTYRRQIRNLGFDLKLALRCVDFCTTKTEAPADLVILERSSGLPRSSGWLKTAIAPQSWGLEDRVRINAYYLDNPDHLIGGPKPSTLRLGGNLCSGVSVNKVPDLADQILSRLMPTPTPTPKPMEPTTVIGYVKEIYAMLKELLEQQSRSSSEEESLRAQIAILQEELSRKTRQLMAVQEVYGELPAAESSVSDDGFGDIV
jgi:SAM-dependent methyltransferase